MVENRTIVQAKIDKTIYLNFKDLVKRKLGIPVRMRLEQLMEKDTFNIKTEVANSQPVNWSVMNEGINCLSRSI